MVNSTLFKVQKSWPICGLIRSMEPNILVTFNVAFSTTAHGEDCSLMSIYQKNTKHFKRSWTPSSGHRCSEREPCSLMPGTRLWLRNLELLNTNIPLAGKVWRRFFCRYQWHFLQLHLQYMLSSFTAAPQFPALAVSRRDWGPPWNTAP